MTSQAQQVNEGFGVPADVEAQLRAQAEAEVAKEFDKAALLEKFRAEARAKLEAELREEALSLEQDKQPNLDVFGFPKEYFKIQIFKGQSKADLGYVAVSVNGYAWKLARGMPLIVHSVVVDALNAAITESVVQHEGGLITTPVHRFPYQIFGGATEAEYIAFKASQPQPAGSKAAA